MKGETVYLLFEDYGMDGDLFIDIFTDTNDALKAAKALARSHSVLRIKNEVMWSEFDIVDNIAYLIYSKTRYLVGMKEGPNYYMKKAVIK